MSRFVLALALCLAAAGAAQATESRNQAMQARGWMIPDDTDLWQLPGELLDYRGAVYGELPGETRADDYAGGHVPLGSLLLRVFAGNLPGRGAGARLLERVRESTYGVGNVQPRNAENNQLCRGELPAGRLHLLLGAPLGRRAQAAIGLEYYGKTWTDLERPAAEDGTQVGSRALDRARLWNLIGGVARPIGPFERLSLGARVGLPSFRGRYHISSLGPGAYLYKAVYESDGGASLGISARAVAPDLLARESESYFYVAAESATLEGTSRHNTREAPAPAEDSRKEMAERSFTAGWSNLHRLGRGLQLVWSAALEWSRSSIDLTDRAYTATDPASFTESRRTTVAWPLTIAAEGWLRPWWAARFSSSSSLATRVTTRARYEDRRYPGRSIPENRLTEDLSDQRFAIGTTLKVGSFRIDGVVNRSLLFDGPYFLGGAATGLASQVSLAYRF